MFMEELAKPLTSFNTDKSILVIKSLSRAMPLEVSVSFPQL